MQSERHPQLYSFFGGYLNQDYELCGDTFEEVVEYFKRVNPRDHCLEMIQEIDAFIAEHPDDLDAAFERDYGQEIDHTCWGYTTATFLQALKHLLKD